MSEFPWNSGEAAPDEATVRREVQVTLLQDILVAHATGRTHPRAHEYETVRLALLKDRDVEPLVPAFVKSCRKLAHFWTFIQPKFEHHSDRKEFIWHEFRAILDHLEAEREEPTANRSVTDPEELYEEVETLQEIMVHRARGEHHRRSSEYETIRRRILRDPCTASYLPSFVRPYRSLDQFWPFIREKFGTYRDRSEFLRNEFAGVLSHLEHQIAAAPTNPSASDRENLTLGATEGICASAIVTRAESSPVRRSSSQTSTRPLRILHISDLHERAAFDGMPERRNSVLRRDATARGIVLGKDFYQSLRDVTKEGVDLVCLTGDVADWAVPKEYERATVRILKILETVGVGPDCLFLVPGNHDVQRVPYNAAWEGVRGWHGKTGNASDLGNWLVWGEEPPPGIGADWDEILRREEVFWQWAKDLGCPANQSPEPPRLGYRHTFPGGTWTGIDVPVQIIGLDSAWLCGDDNDQGKILLTAEQVLAHVRDGEHALDGLRIVLMHHPITELADQHGVWGLLAENVDLVLHGHQHTPLAWTTSNPDASLRTLAAGCLMEGKLGKNWPNGFQLVEVDVGAKSYTVHLRKWARDAVVQHWATGSGIYRDAPDGVLRWASPASAAILDRSYTVAEATQTDPSVPPASKTGQTGVVQSVTTPQPRGVADLEPRELRARIDLLQGFNRHLKEWFNLSSEREYDNTLYAAAGREAGLRQQLNRNLEVVEQAVDDAGVLWSSINPFGAIFDGMHDLASDLIEQAIGEYERRLQTARAETGVTEDTGSGRLVVFYSWQSDRPNSLNRGFIGDAVEKAAKTITSEGVVEVVVDTDTVGVPGAPDISATIFDKITKADVFVADVTNVSDDGGQGRSSPNPNVLLELGFAIKTLGWERVVLVMNTAFGGVELLPFDLRSHRVVRYELKTGDDKAQVRRGLSKRLEAGIRSIVTSGWVANVVEPSLTVSLGDPKSRNVFGDAVTVVSKVLRKREVAPELKALLNPLKDVMTVAQIAAAGDWNRPKPAEVEAYRKELALLNRLGFCVANEGSGIAENVTLKFQASKEEALRLCKVLPEEPRGPSAGPFAGIPALRFKGIGEPSTKVEDREHEWEVECEIGDIRAGESRWSEPFFVGSTVKRRLELTVQVFGDNLRAIELPMAVQIDTKDDWLEQEFEDDGDDAETSSP